MAARGAADGRAVVMERLTAVDWRRVATAGVAGSLAYLAEMALDMRLLRYPQNDLVLQGRLVPALTPIWPLAGLALHTGFGTLLALAYALVGRERLPGPPWLRGALLLVIENILLWPLTRLVDRYHPAVRDGQMPPMNTPRCFAQAVLRHLAFGVVLGLVYEAGGRRPKARGTDYA